MLLIVAVARPRRINPWMGRVFKLRAGGLTRALLTCHAKAAVSACPTGEVRGQLGQSGGRDTQNRKRLPGAE